MVNYAIQNAIANTNHSERLNAKASKPYVMSSTYELPRKDTFCPSKIIAIFLLLSLFLQKPHAVDTNLNNIVRDSLELPHQVNFNKYPQDVVKQGKYFSGYFSYLQLSQYLSKEMI